jgi:NAD(P)-dependent dehydrogenase (short-subunit alcohol dehydrogenase family)
MRDTDGKNADKAKALAQIENITVLNVTLTDDASVKNAIDIIIAAEGTIDVLVNNAGVTMFGVAESATPADVQRVFDVNFMAPWRLMKLALPYMRTQSEGLSEGLHYELRPLGVDVAIIQPGAFPTEMSQKVQFGSDTSVLDGYQAIAAFPDKMFGAIGEIFETTKPDPQDVADAVVTLINLPKGQRPLRTVVDPSTGEIIKTANDAVNVEYAKVLTAFGLKDLLA